MSAQVGLVGCGSWGRNILRDLLHLGCHVSVAELDPRHRRQAQTMGAQTVVADLAALPEVEGLIVATPATTHARVIAQLLDRAVPLFTEKPFAIDVAAAERLVEQAGDRLFVMHVWRYHPGIERLAEIARSGVLGPVCGLRTTRANWTSPRRDVDIVWTLAPHDLSIALEVLGTLPAPRLAFAERNAGQTVGLFGLLGEAPWLALEVSARYADKRREVRLHCAEGVAVLSHLNSTFLAIAHGDPGTETPKRETWPFPTHEQPLYRELRAFVTYLTGGPPPRSTAAEGLAVVQAVVALRRLAGLAQD